ncbi:MAG TPA: efflux RND transporter periplasmic adaptor subunit [Vicinamibacterales bacterium]
MSPKVGRLVIYGAIGIATSAVGLASQGRVSQAPATKAPTAVTVNVTPVVSQVLDRAITLPGDLSAFQDVEIRARVAGFVDTVNVDRGAIVKKGQLLARLAAPELTAQRHESEAKVQSAQSQRVEAEARLAADEGTYQHLKGASATPGVVAGNDVEVALRATEADRARVESARQNERAAQESARSVRDMETYLRITAPFDGIVTERSVHQGSLVGPTTPPLLRVQQVARLRLVVALPEDAVADTRQGQGATFTVPAFPGETFSGKVARVSHALDAKTRTMPVELDVSNVGNKLAPGMFANVAWTMRRTHPSLFVPPSAIAATTERTFVVRVRNGQTEWVDVKRGATMGPLVEVFGDLHAGDQVAVRGTDELRIGSRVVAKIAPTGR